MADVEIATGDGTLDTFPSEDADDIEPEDCDCDGLGGFPCWLCVRTGRKGLPNEPPLQLFQSIPHQSMSSDLADQRTLTESADAATNRNGIIQMTETVLPDAVKH